MARLHVTQNTPLPPPGEDVELVTTTDPEVVRQHLGFTYAVVFQDDQLVPGFAMTVCNKRTPQGDGKGDKSSSAVVSLAGGPQLVEASKAHLAEHRLEGRTVYDSWVQLKVPLSSNVVFRKAFQDVDGSARVGRLLELADGLAADVGYRHAIGGYRAGVGITIATASIYSLVLNGKEFTDKDDILMRAYITRVGSSSMEVCIEIDQVVTATRAHAFFVMVALDHTTNRAFTVPKIPDIPSKIQVEAGRRHARRQAQREQSIDDAKFALSDQDLQDLHTLWRKQWSARGEGARSERVSAVAADERRMAENRLETTLLIWPNEMNVHGTLFGGIVTRTAIEVSYMTVAQYLHSTAWAALLAVDDVFFLNPIPSGAMTKYIGQVIYTEGADAVVRVEVLMVPPRQHPAIWQRGTIFYFHYRWPPAIPRVVPESYEDYLLFMEGRRRHRECMSLPARL